MFLKKFLFSDNYDEFVSNLFDYSSLINEKNDMGENLLHFSVYYGMIDKYLALFNIGVEVVKTNNGDNLLHYSVYSGKDDYLVIELLDYLNPFERNTLGESSFHLIKNTFIASYFFNLFQNFDSLIDNDGNTIIHSAYKYGHKEVVRFWAKKYPNLKEVKNNKGLLYNQLTLSSKNFCKEV
jgi:ankyrin repeat protein